MGPWTLPHFYQIVPTFLILAPLSVLIAKLLSGCKRKIKYIPLQVISTLLLVLEVIKQINAASQDGSYDLFALPFHYCSLFIYLLPLHSFYHGKHSRITDATSFGILSALMLFMILMPSVVYTDENIIHFFDSYRDFHTVFFHNLVVFYFMLTLALKLYEFDVKRDLTIIGVFLSIYVVIASILAYSLKTNFHNLYRCNIGFIEDMRLCMVEKIGVFGTLIYVSGLFIATILFTFAAYGLSKLFVKTTEKLNVKNSKANK